MSRRRHKSHQKNQPAKPPQIFHSADRRNIVGAPLPKKFTNQYKKPTAR